MQPVRTALIGCGKVGGIHAQALATLRESKFMAVCDADSARAQSFAARYAVEPFDSVEKMLSIARPEAVTVCTPHPLHEQPCALAASAGVHVLVEKPLASSLAACDRMIAAAEKSGVKLGVVSQRRLLEPVQRMKAAIAAGKIGAPILGVFQMFSWRDEAYYRSDPWRGKWSTEGGGVLVNQSAHHLDLLQWFMGPIDEISGYWANLNHPYIEVDDTALAMIRFKTGALGSIVTSISQEPGIYAKIHVHGSNGASVGVETDSGATFVAGMTSVAAPPLNDLWTISGEEHLLADFQAADRDRFKQIDATTHYHALQIQDFLRSIREGRPPLVTGRDGRTVVEMFTAVYRSNELRRPVKFPVIEFQVPPESAAFMKELASRFSSVSEILREHIQDNDEILPHVMIGDVERHVLAGGADASQIVQFLEDSYGRRGDDVDNVIAVSFIEGLTRIELETALNGVVGNRLREEWQRQRLSS